MPIDVEKLLGSLDEDTLKKLQNALNDAQTKETKEDENSSDSKSDNDNISENNGSITKSRAVKPYIFFVTITPDDWEQDGDNWIHKREIYTDEYQLRESGILSMYIDEEKMLKDLKGDDYKEVDDLINHICEKGLIKIKSDNIVGTFTYMDKEKPTRDISVVIEELPFPDCPASSLGL